MPTVDPVSGTATPDLNKLIGGVEDTSAPKAKDPNSYFDKDMFLQLLVAQMKYQNPMNPTDPNEFMAQASQLAMVEKMTEMTKSQTDATQWQINFGAAAMIGKTITGTDATGQTVQGVVSKVTITGGVASAMVNNIAVPVANITSITETTTKK